MTDPLNPQATVDSVFNALLWASLAGVGGAVKYVSSAIQSTVSISYRRFWTLLFANTFISSFCGLMGGLLATSLTTNHVFQLLAAGSFGYLGIQSLDFAILAVKKKVDPSFPVAAVVPVVPQNDGEVVN